MPQLPQSLLTQTSRRDRDMDDKTQWAASEVCKASREDPMMRDDQCLALNHETGWSCNCGRRDEYLRIASAALNGATKYDRFVGD